MFDQKNSYPVILVPGVLGYGEETVAGKILPYFGMTATNVSKVIKSFGMDCHTPTFGLLSGVWDRACELYAQIVGGTVDYGEAHSQKYGHARYGKTYEKAMVPDWGKISEDGNPVKITLIAHGFGAPVARLFIELLNYGAKDELDKTSEGNVSGLFKGGNRNLVHCLVTLAGVNEGISIAQALEDKFPGAQRALVKAAVSLEELSLYKDYVDPYYQKHGLTVTQHELSAHYTKPEADNKKIGKVKYDEDNIARYLSKSDDNIFFDMGIDGMRKLNMKLNTAENTYYLSFTGSVTTNLMGKITLPKPSAGVTMPFAALISTFENYLPEFPIVTPAIAENDGLVNTNSSLAPESEPVSAFRSVERCNPGTWYQMPVENRNHLSFIGLFNRPDKYRNEIYDLMKMVCNLESV